MLDRRQFLAGATIAAGAATLSRSVFAADEPRPIRIAQIGVAHGHANKLADYRKLPEYEVVGIAEADPALRKSAEDQPAYKGLRWMSQDELLASNDVDAVLVETSIDELLPTAAVCLDAGKHVHIDKPAGASLPQLKQVLATAQQRGLLVQTGYMYRYNPATTLLHDFVRQGWLGEIFEVHAVMSKVVAPNDRARFAKFSGGMMFELGCHLVDLTVGLLGKPNKVTPYLRHTSPIDDKLTDNALAVLEYDGAIAAIRSSALEVGGFGRRHFVVCGTKGTFHIQPLDDPKVQLTLDQPQGDYKAGTQTIELPKYSRYVADALAMAAAIRNKTALPFSAEHDLAVQQTVLEASGMSTS